MKYVYSCLLLILSSLANSDSFYFNTQNNFGTLGLINTPSARFYDSPAASLSFLRSSPDRKITLTLHPYDWLEGSIFYSSLSNRRYGEYNTQDYKDKGINLKFRLKEEGIFPAIAVGFYDIGGTGFYSSEYIVSSYAFGNFDFHFGGGWGRLNHHNHYKNPFSLFSNRFKERSSDIDLGGKFSFDNFFSGKNMSFFGGLNYAINKNLVFKIEYDPLETPGAVGFKERKNDISFGINYLMEKYSFALNYERGSNLSLNFSLKDNFLIEDYKFKPLTKRNNGKYQNLIDSLRLNSVGVSKIKEVENKTFLEINQYKHDYPTLIKILDFSIKDADFKEEVVASFGIAGLKVIDNEKSHPASKTVYESFYRGVNDGFSLNIRPFIAGREDFFKFGLMLEHDAEFILSKNLFFSTNIKFSLFDNFDDLIFPPLNTYPAQVRSDIKKYLNNIGDKPSIGRAQLEYFRTIKKDNHILLTAGIYEDMFSGYGFEYLNFNPFKRLNWGLEVHEAFKRDYNFDFGLLDYSNTTYFLNIFYKNRMRIPFDVKLSIGEYLAGDRGTTIELSRSMKNGIEFGVFASLTNVSEEQFGEGSFDKGIFFKIPIGSDKKSTNFLWRPLTKDPASKLVRKNDIYSLVNRLSAIENY